VEPSGLVANRGTGVRLILSNSLSPLLDPGFLESGIKRHFAPLLDPDSTTSSLRITAAAYVSA
jgi:hypothetical protein